METCFRCGISSDRTILYDAISKEGIVKVCEKCRIKDNLPIIRRTRMVSDPEKPITVRQRLSYMSGLKPKEPEKPKEIIGQDEELKKIITKKYEEDLKNLNIKADTSGNEGMVRNFHWIIMRARRARHWTQKEFANSIQEPELAIKLAEQGILPREHEALVRKIQNALNVRITEIPYDTYTKLPPQEVKDSEEPFNEDYDEFQVDSEKEKRWTIGDLLRIKKRVKVKDQEKISIADALKDEEIKEE